MYENSQHIPVYLWSIPFYVEVAGATITVSFFTPVTAVLNNLFAVMEMTIHLTANSCLKANIKELCSGSQARNCGKRIHVLKLISYEFNYMYDLHLLSLGRPLNMILNAFHFLNYYYFLRKYIAGKPIFKNIFVQ